MSRFNIIDLPIFGLKLIERHRLGHTRGYLSRIFCAEELADAGWCKPIAQINHTYTAKCGTVRGMHFQQSPFTEMKLVSCLRGAVWDVAVDLRAGSNTFLNWHAEHLSADNNRAMLIPEGFAHGFQTICDDVELLYCHSVAYNQKADAGINPNDRRLSITWPLEIIQLSERDATHPDIDDKFTGLEI